MPRTSNRRSFLAGLAAAPAVALPALARAAVPNDPLLALIEHHRATYKQFNDICGFEDHVAEDDPRFAELRAEWEWLNDAEDDAMNELLAFPVRTLEQAKVKAAYLGAHFERGDPQAFQFMAFLESLAA
jgi:hypothetical protein